MECHYKMMAEIVLNPPVILVYAP